MKRVFNVIMCLVAGVLAFLYDRQLFFLPDGDTPREQGQRNAAYILAFLFTALFFAFGWRVIRPKKKVKEAAEANAGSTEEK